MAYCGPRGIALSAFLKWDLDDQEAALGWQIREAGRCTGCGTHPDDWDERDDGHRFAWVPHIRSCPGCERVHLAQNSDQVKGKPGMNVYLTRGPRG